MSAEPSRTGLCRLRVLRVRSEGSSGIPSLLLQEEDGRRCLAIPVGLGEAQALSAGMGEVQLTRPLCHDLLAQSLRLGGLTLVHAELQGPLSGGCYQADLLLRDSAGRDHRLPARPADAIALALRVGAPVVIADEVLMASRWVDLPVAPLPLGRTLGAAEPRRPCVSPRALQASLPTRRPKWRM